MIGIIPVNKPRGFTSHDVVAKARGILKTRRIGHGGTLDPLATGVLPLFIGAATRAVDLAPKQGKRYTAVVKMGIKTDSGDITGDVIESLPPACESALREAIAHFTGEIRQQVPMYSAVRVGGKRLYELARKGREAERPVRSVTIENIELIGVERGGFTIDVSCSKGTYIRTLAEDICEAASTVGTIEQLCRTESGGFSLSDCCDFDAMEKAAAEGRISELLVPVERVFDTLPKVELDAEDERRFMNGVRLQTDRQEGLYRVYGGQFIAAARVSEGSLIKCAAFVEDMA